MGSSVHYPLRVWVKLSVPSISKEILSTGMPPMSNSPHALVTTANVSNNSQNLANFENLLPRSPYIPPDVNNTMASGNAANSLNSSSLQPPPPPPRSSAPPAHQSPKQVGKNNKYLRNTFLSTAYELDVLWVNQSSFKVVFVVFKKFICLTY